MGEIRVKSENLFDISSDIHGYINSSGNFVPNNSYTATDYIEIPPNARTLYCSVITKSGQPVYTGLHIAVYDKNKTLLTYDMDYNKSKISMSVDISLGKYFRADVCGEDYTECMVSFENVPYEPYFLNLPSHEKTANGWKDIPTHTMTATGWQGELTSQSPLEFRATGQSLLDWRVEGRTSENLFDKNNTVGIEDNYYINQNTGDKSSDSLYYISAPIAVTSGERYYWIFRLTSGGNPHSAPTVGFYDANDNQIGVASHNSRVQSFPFTPPTNCAYIRASVYKTDINEAMLVKSSIAPTSYEPYGGVGDWDETEQKYVIPVTVESENLFVGELEQGGIAVSGNIVTSSSRVYGYAYVKPQTAYTITSNKAFRSCYGYNDDGTNINKVGLICDNISGSNKLTTFTTPEGCNYIRFAMWNSDESNIIPTDIQNLNLVEGTYTASTIPPYEVNLFTDHQLMDGDSIDFTTDQTTIPIATGNNTLTVDTAVQPSKVFVKFEG